MKGSRFVFAAVIFGAVALNGSPVALAAEVQPFGSVESLNDASGAAVTSYAVRNLTPSSDHIPFPVAGQLYEATVTANAQRGTVTPIVSQFSSRAADGTTYQALANVATPQGLNANPLAQGASSTGKIYFDVTGPAPDSVVYNNGVEDLLIWKGANISGSAPAVGNAAVGSPGVAPGGGSAGGGAPGSTAGTGAGSNTAGASGPESYTGGSTGPGGGPAAGTNTATGSGNYGGGATGQVGAATASGPG